jgi:3-oxoacyl-[acyl-carrier protein] reductase
MNLENKVIMITGAAGGIGKASAKICAGYGAKIVAVDRIADGVKLTEKELRDAGHDAIGVEADVTKRSSIRNAVSVAIKKYGRIDGLFNNAGVVKSTILVECSEEEYDYVMGINTRGAFIVATEVAKQMIQQRRGRIVSTSSISALREEYSNGVYCMSKAAVSMMTRVLALELGKYNISAVAICPGHINTELLQNAWKGQAESQGKEYETFVKEMEKTISLGRLAQPEEVGELVAFLFDDRSAYMDGNSVLFAGGKLMA